MNTDRWALINPLGNCLHDSGLHIWYPTISTISFLDYTRICSFLSEILCFIEFGSRITMPPLQLWPLWLLHVSNLILAAFHRLPNQEHLIIRAMTHHTKI